MTRRLYSFLLACLSIARLALVRRWWRRQSPTRQDRFVTLGPLLSVVLFLAAVIAAFTYLRLEEVDREQQAVGRDVEYAQQRLRLRLLERQEQLMRLARDVSNRDIDSEEFVAQAESLLSQYPELLAVSWIDSRGRIRANAYSPSALPTQMLVAGQSLPLGETESNFALARDLRQPVYSRPLLTSREKGDFVVSSTATLQVLVPLEDQNKFNGVVLG